VRLTLEIWRQKDAQDAGRFAHYDLPEVSEHMSFLEMLDVLNQELIGKGEEPVAFDHDCREGICGSCSMMINGRPHGPELGTATCQLHMRKFSDGAKITVEPWRAASFPIVRDLVVDRSAFDRIIESGGYITAPTGSAIDGNMHLIPKDVADTAMDAAQCIGCGACVAACPNGAAQLFTSAKVMHLNLLPQGQAERWQRVTNMVNTMEQYFGSCTNHGECQTACPKEISVDFIALMNRDYIKAQFKQRRLASQRG
jgi:succinate dehydrogenase / fumarate reductase iron-sulfur subunit